ncbi:MAG: SpvB/TcaC N-terminal domain-containing protein, partial [Pseudomonadota bacterium]
MVAASIAIGLLAAPALAADRSGVRPEVLSVPSGPGSILGLGVAFKPSHQTGSATYSVSIRVPPGVNGLVPSLSLNYSPGASNSEVGLGWSLDFPFVQRSTDRRLPAYDDSDVFVVRGMGGGGAEELVRMTDGSYRFRIEGAFVRAERRTDGTWVARNRSGNLFVFGEEETATIRDGDRVFAWLLARQEDTFGNRIVYQHERDETGRPYLARIVYNDFGAAVRNEIRLTYETRPDVLTSYLSTFATRIARRLATIEVFHGGELLLRYQLGYQDESGLSRLSSVQATGRDGKTALPPLTLAYVEPQPENATVVAIADAPARVLGETSELDDVDGDGLADL